MAEETPRLYIGNLPYTAQKVDVEKLFADNGIQIVSAKIDMSTDPFSGRNPSYCFVEFPDADAANRAMKTMQGQDLGGRAIRINPKTERRQPTGERPQNRGWGPRDNQAPRTGGYNSSGGRWNNDQARGNEPAEEGRRVYVGGLPRIQGQECLEAEMNHLFQGYNLQVVSKLITPHASAFEEDGFNSYCFADLATPEDAKNAVTMLNGQPTPHGGAYKVRHAHAKKRDDNRGVDAAPSDRFGGGRFGGERPPPRTEPTSTSRVYVGGLPQLEPQDLLDSEIRKVFAGFEIEKVSNLITPRVRDDQEQQSGNFFYCFVDFASTEVAQQAVDAFDGKPSPSGEPLKVRLARERQPQEGSGAGRQRGGGFGGGYNSNTPSKPRDFGGSWRRAN